MEDQKQNEIQTENHVVLSESLLKGSCTGLSGADEDFIQQNDLINEELRKYDKQLDSCPMRIYKAWTFIYVPVLCFLVWDLFVFLSRMLQGSVEWDWEGFALVTIALSCSCISIYMYLLLWRALHSKDIFKVEKCIYIFKILLMISIIYFFFDLSLSMIRKIFTWERVLNYLLAPTVSTIDLGTAVFVKKVLLQRDVFQQVSSYPKPKK